MAKLFNRAKMTTTTTGSGTITLGSASNGFQSFADAGVADGDVVQYVIEEGANFEIGTGTYSSSGTSLTRSPTESSNSNNAITLAGQATVSITAVADDLNRLQHNGTDKVTVSSTGASVSGNLAVSGTVDGVDIASRDGVLTTTKTTADAALPKAGGTMTGGLIVDHNSSPMLKVQATNGSPWALELGRDDATNSKVYNGGGYWSFEHEPRYYNGGSPQKLFHDGYHPNADKWTTSRTLSLTGGVTGSVSWDGSANASLTSTVALATASAVGGIQIGYTENGKNYPVELSSGKAFVNVPWTDTNTNQLTTFVVQDGDSTNVTISQGKYLKFAEGGAIDVNFTDTSTGSSGDPYDLTISHADTSSQGSVDNSNGNVIQDVTLDTYGHVTGLGSVDLDNRYIRNDANDTGTGGYSTSGTYWEVGNGTGSVAINTNDGYGNANLTFNHHEGVPDISGNAARIEVNVDSSSGANMNFEVKSGVTGGTAVQPTSILNLSESQVTAYKTLYENSNRVFTDGYHPNADGWTTARSHTVTLTGAVTGTASQSVDGTGNKTWSIATSYNDNGPNWVDPATGNYGTVKVDDDRSVTWAGWAIRDDWVFMANGAAEAGIYNDTDNEWGIKFFQNARTALYYDANEQFRTESAGVSTDGGMRVGAFGNSHNAGGIEVNTSNNEKIVLSGSNDPYIRWQEGTTDRAYIQWVAGQDALLFRNQQTDNFDFMPDASTGAVNLRLRGSDNDTWGSLYADDGQNVGILDEGQSWAIKHVNDTGTYFYTDGSTEEFKVGRDTVTGDYGTVQTTTSKGSWGGYSIKGNWVFMGSDDGNASGIYNDMDNEWGVIVRRNAEVELYHNGSMAMETVGSTGIRVGSTTSSDIYMQDTNEGERRIHCNSNKLGFLNSSNSWSFYSEDSGRVVAESGIYNKGVLDMGTTGSLQFQTNSNGGYIPHPRGGSYITSTNAHTGAIKIKFPTNGTADMLTFHVDIFDYSESESVTLFIAGYLYQTNTANEWVNCEVVNLTGNSGKDYTVRFGADSTGNCVWIGETSSTWSYPQVLVRDLHVGYTSNVNSYDTGFAISFVTAFDTVDETHSNNFPQARNSQYLDGVVGSSYMRKSANSQLDMNNYDIVGVDQIVHEGDTDTYMQFHAADQWRVVTGGTERFEVNNDTSTFQTHVKIDGGHNLQVGDGAGNERILIQKADNNVSDHIIFYNGTTRLGEIGCEDTTWLRINQETAKNIYTPRMIRADGGFQASSTICAHVSDTDTYLQFHATDQFRVVVGGSERLEVKNSSPHVLVTGDLNSTSDARLKENVEPIANALSDITQLEGVSFDWKDTGTRGHGFIAQQVEPILPDVVNTDDETGIKSINYVGMIGHLVEAIKEQQTQIDELTQQVQELKNK